MSALNTAQKKCCYYHRLSNGLDVVGCRLTSVRSVAVGLQLPAGSALEGEQVCGRAKMAYELLAHEGTSSPRLPADLRKGTDFGPSWVWFWRHGLSHHLPQVLQQLLASVSAPTVQEDTFIPIRNRIKQAILHAQQYPGLLWRDALHHHLFAGTPLAQQLLPRLDLLNQLTPSMIESTWNTYYKPGGSVLTVVGCFDWDTLIRELEETWTAWQGSASPINWGHLQVSTRAFFVHKGPGNEQQLLLALPLSIAKQNEQHYPTAQILSYVLGGMRSSRLYTKVRQVRGLAYEIGTTLEASEVASTLFIKTSVSPEHAVDVLELILHELGLLTTSGIHEEELCLAKIQLLSEAVRREEQLLGLVRGLTDRWCYTHKVSPIRENLQTLMQVQRPDVMHLLQQSSPCSNITISTLGPLAPEAFAVFCSSLTGKVLYNGSLLA